MNKQSLYLVGGAALLASTALSTTDAQAAATITAVGTNGATAGHLPTATLTAAGLATQVFSATTSTANTVTISGGQTTATGAILIDISPTFVTFDVKLDISSDTGAFSTTATPTVRAFYATSTGTLEPFTSVTGCTVQPSAERLTLLACNPTGWTPYSRVDALLIQGITYTSAAALRTAGTSITLSGATFLSNSSSTIDAITPKAVITSRSAVASASVSGGGTVTIDNNATVAFGLLVSSGTTTTTSAVLGSVVFSASGAVSTDLATAFTATGIFSTAELKITHSVLTDPALTSIVFSGNSKTVSSVVSGTVTFTLVDDSFVSAGSIVANFANNGTKEIQESTGTATAVVTPLSSGSDSLVTNVSSFSGSLATLTRGGLSVEMNGIVVGSMSSSYVSFLKIVNQSATPSTAKLIVRNEASGGDPIATYTTASIPAYGALQVSGVDIDTGIGSAALSTGSYKVTVTGSFNGYVQHLLFTVDGGVFSDASGFRNGTLTTDP